MEIKQKKSISQKDKELLLNSLNSLFASKSSSHGYKYDIEAILKDIAITENEYFSVVIESFSKTKRNNEDLTFITSYFFFMQEFIKLLKAKESFKREIKLLNYLMHLSSDIFYIEIPKDVVLMKYGDKGEKAYINLSGQVDVLIPNSKIIHVYENDYLLYLASLIKYKEYDLINFVLNDNFPNYHLIIYDDFSSNEQIPSIFKNIIINKKKISTFIKGKNNEIIKKLLDADIFMIDLKLKLEKINKRIKGIMNLSGIDNEGKTQEEDINQINPLQKAFKLNSSNEELLKSLDLYIISSKQLLDLFNFFNYNDNDEEIINCSSEFYINRISIKELNDKTNIKKIQYNPNNSIYELKIYFYTKIVSLGKGNFFGELALRDSNSVRTATIITTSDCHFAYLNRKTYNSSLKTNTELHLKNKLTFFINLPIFSDIPLILFYKKYYTHISKHYLMKNKFALKQGDKPSQLCLLNKGSYELICNMNLRDLTELIFYLMEKIKKYQNISQQNKLNQYKDLLRTLRESDDRIKKILPKNTNFQELYVKESLLKISEISCPDITGFEEMIGKDGLYSFSLQAKTIENVIYYMDFNFYEDFYNKNPLVQKKHDYIVRIKLDLIIKRLVKIRNNIISSFFNHKIEDDLGIIVSKEIETLQNQKKNGKRFLNLKNTKYNFDINNNIKEKDLFKNKINHYNYFKNNNNKEDKNLSNHNKTLMLNNKTIFLENKKENNCESDINLKLKIKNKDSFYQTHYKNLFIEDLTYYNLIPVIKLRKSSYKEKPVMINKKEEKEDKTLTEYNHSLRGKKINKSIKCYFDKKIKIINSLNITEKLKKKKELLNLENLKINSIPFKKKKEVQKEALDTSLNTSKNKRMQNNDKNKLDFYRKLLAIKTENTNINMLELTNKIFNLTNKDSFFHKTMGTLINTPVKRDNKKEKIKEILKEEYNNDNNMNNINRRISFNKRDDYYKKNLIRLKLLYGFDKK